MNILDRWAQRRLEQGGFLRSYSPAPSAILGMGMIDWPGDSEHDPELYLKYARTSNVVYSCAMIRANMLAGLPLRAYKLGADAKAGRVMSIREPHERMGMPLDVRGRRIVDAQDVTEVEGGKLVTLLRHVNRWWTPRRLVHMTEMSLCLAGQAFWQLDKGEKANRPPSDIYYLKHTRMAPVKDATEIIGGWTLDPNTRGAQKLGVEEIVWVRYADPADPDYGALPPLAAARLGADTYAAAMKSNWAIFSNGLAPGGFVMPPEGQVWSDEQLDEAQEAIRARLEGTDKRHRWLFLPEAYSVEANTMTPRDAEFLGGLDFSVEDVARAYGLPIELVGGARRTYQNLENAMRAVWMFTLEPEASFLAAELTEQLVPQFGGEVDFVAFDLNDVTALQEDEAHRWAREREQIMAGVVTGNEWRAEQGLDPLSTGAATLEVGKVTAVIQAAMAVATGQMAPDMFEAILVNAVGLDPMQAKAIASAGGSFVPAPQEPVTVGGPNGLGKAETAAAGGTDGEGRGARLIASPSDDLPDYGTPEHERMWRAEMEKVEPHERAMVKLLDGLFERQMQSLLDKMGGRGARMSIADLRAMFDMGRWIREFRTAVRPLLFETVTAAGGDLFADMGGGEFDGDDPEVVRAMMAQSQKFATEVTETTWADLQRTISQGMGEGESLPLLQRRIEDTFRRYMSEPGADVDELAAKISRSEMIARTETTRAWNKGGLEAAKQNPNVKQKQWVTAIDGRQRDSHKAMHNKVVDKDKPFEVPGPKGGTETAEAPGDPNLSAGNSVNCRCTVRYVTGTFVDKPLAQFDDKGNLIPQG